jgi:hypothetical protein
MFSNVSKSKKKYLSSPFNLLKSEVQVQETFLKKKKKGNISNISKSKKIPLPTFNLLKSKVQIQETSLKKKKERECLVTFPIPKSKKKKIPSIQLTILEFSIQEAKIQSLGNVPIEKKRKGKKKGNISNIPKSKKIILSPV